MYDELQIAEFNDKAKTADGKPLALGNGKIIDQPLFTSKTTYILLDNAHGMSLINVQKKGIQLVHFGEMPKTGQVKLLAMALK